MIKLEIHFNNEIVVFDGEDELDVLTEAEVYCFNEWRKLVFKKEEKEK